MNVSSKYENEVNELEGKLKLRGKEALSKEEKRLFELS